MKKLIVEESGEGLVKLLGQRITLYCLSYIYAGTLIGVNDDCVLLDDAKIVYETGAHTDKKWSVAEPIPTKKWYVMTSKIEAFGVFKDD